MSQTAEQLYVVAQGETLTPALGFIDQLRSGELLTGTPTVAEVTSSDLTISNVGLNSGTITVDGVSHAANQAVQWSISGQLAATGKYRIRVTVSTDATPAQTLVGYVLLDVVNYP